MSGHPHNQEVEEFHVDLDPYDHVHMFYHEANFDEDVSKKHKHLTYNVSCHNCNKILYATITNQHILFSVTQQLFKTALRKTFMYTKHIVHTVFLCTQCNAYHILRTSEHYCGVSTHPISVH